MSSFGYASSYRTDLRTECNKFNELMLYIWRFYLGLPNMACENKCCACYCGSSISSALSIDFKKIEKEGEKLGYLMDTVLGTATFMLAVSSFSLEGKAENLIISLCSLIFVVVLALAIIKSNHRTLDRIIRRKNHLEKSAKISDCEKIELKDISEALKLITGILRSRKTVAFSFSFICLILVIANNVVWFMF